MSTNRQTKGTGPATSRGPVANGNAAFSREPSQETEQIHLRISRAEAGFLRESAERRDQTLSAFVRFLLRRYRQWLIEQGRDR